MRWYDNDPTLQSCLDGLKTMSPEARQQAVSHALEILEAVAPGFVDEHVAEFELPFMGGRRWYDEDGPDTWLLFHGLEVAPYGVRAVVTASLSPFVHATAA